MTTETTSAMISSVMRTHRPRRRGGGKNGGIGIGGYITGPGGGDIPGDGDMENAPRGSTGF
jgi:hypothetical protein